MLWNGTIRLPGVDLQDKKKKKNRKLNTKIFVKSTKAHKTTSHITFLRCNAFDDCCSYYYFKRDFYSAFDVFVLIALRNA